MNTAVIVIICVAAFLFLIYMGIGGLIAKKFIAPKKKSYKQCIERQLKKGKITEDDITIPFEEFKLKSNYGYDIYARLYRTEQPADKYILWMHGYRASAYSGIKLAKLYNSFGYNVLIPESRHCGKSGGRTITFGLKEKEDAKLWINEIKKLCPDAKLAIAGESLGAATAIWIASELKDQFSFLIADSSYFSLKDIIKGHIGVDYPDFCKIFYPPFAVMATLLYGVRPDKIQIGERLRQVTIPTLLTHAVSDEVTAYANALKLKEVKPDAVYVPYEGCSHTMAVVVHCDRYRKMTEDFLKSIGEIN